MVLDERGKALSSLEFANRMSMWRDDGIRDIVFMIGGADGHHDRVRGRADLLFSLGRATWPRYAGARDDRRAALPSTANPGRSPISSRMTSISGMTKLPYICINDVMIDQLNKLRPVILCIMDGWGQRSERENKCGCPRQDAEFRSPDRFRAERLHAPVELMSGCRTVKWAIQKSGT